MLESYPVSSEAIALLEYDDETEECYVTFHSGGRYKIPEFPASEFRAWLTARSKGSFFNTNVKGQY